MNKGIPFFISLLFWVGQIQAQSSIEDVDGNTKIETERNGDNDVIWFQTNGTDRLRIIESRLEFLRTGKSIFIGDNAGANDDKTNNQNLFIGESAGEFTVGGFKNVGLGRFTLNQNVSGNFNTAIGGSSLQRTMGSYNVGLGSLTLAFNTTGERNVAIGHNALRIATTASRNTAIGASALQTCLGGDNVGIGFRSGFQMTNGIQNTLLGYESGYNVGNGSNNIFIGYQAGYSDTSSNRLYIENSNSTTPLIYGEFDTDKVKIHGTLAVSQGIMDSDGNTGIQLEESPDDNIIRFDVEGKQRWSMEKNRIQPFGNSIFIGKLTGDSISSIYGYNIGVGDQALSVNTSGYENTAIGSWALRSNKNGVFNTALGSEALEGNVDGSYNTGLGRNALHDNSAGNLNTALGYSAARQNTTGRSNVALGANSLFWNTTVSNLVAIGDSALYSNGIGATGSEAIQNTAVGTKALFANTKGSANTALGSEALRGNTEGIGNTSLGHNSMFSNTTGSYNAGVGSNALFHNSTGISNVGVGRNTLYLNTTGNENIAVGRDVLYDNSTGSENCGVGSYVLANNTTGYENTAIGQGVLNDNTTGYQNCALGSQALGKNTTAPYNVAIGYNALRDNQTGSSNTAIGALAMQNGSNRYYSVAVGWNSNTATTGNNSTGLGYNTDCTASDQVRIGNNSVMSIGGYQNWTNVSDQRFKQNVQENVAGLDFINALRPVTYTLDQSAIEGFFQTNYGEVDSSMWATKYDASYQIRTGFLAQEVEAAAQSLGYDFSGVDTPKNEKDFYGLRYAEFTVPLVKAVQELSLENEELEIEVNDLKKNNEQLKMQYEKQAGQADLALVFEKMALMEETLERQSAELAKLKSNMSFCCEKSDTHLHILNADRAYLEQNTPNPFATETTIRYYLPSGTENAMLRVLSKEGRMIQELSLQGEGLGSVRLSTTDLADGTYRYALVVDGKMMESKMMVVVRH